MYNYRTLLKGTNKYFYFNTSKYFYVTCVVNILKHNCFINRSIFSVMRGVKDDFHWLIQWSRGQDVVI